MLTRADGCWSDAVGRFRDAGIALPRFGRARRIRPASDPSAFDATAGGSVGPDDPHPLNLFRVQLVQRRRPTAFVAVPEHVVLPRELTGVDATDRRRARRPLPDDRARTRCSPPTAASRRALVTGRFDPTRASRRLALHRQLLPRRRRDLAPDGLPRRRGAARGDEP